MTVIEIRPNETEWTIRGMHGEEASVAGSDTERLAAIDQFIDEYHITGGAITTPTMVASVDKTVDLADYLSKKHQQPFIYSTLDNYMADKADWLWTIRDEYLKSGNDAYASESLLTVGNGYLGLRGTTPEMTISDDTYPALYLAGLYDEATSDINGNAITNEDFVNAPNMQCMYVKIDDEVVDLTTQKIIDFSRSLDLKTGLFRSEATVQLVDGKQLTLASKRIANMQNVHEYSIQYSVTPKNFSGEMTLMSEAHGDVFNYNVARYRDLNQKHLHVVDLSADQSRMTLVAETLTSKIQVSQTAQLFFPEHIDDSALETVFGDETITQQLTFDAREGDTYTFEKTIHVSTSMDDEAQVPETLLDFETSYQQSEAAWQELWKDSHVQIVGDDYAQRLMNLNTFHVLVSASPNAYQESPGHGLTARGLHGEAYRGHVFWDELFILPFYIAHFPATARELLRYRYLRLDEAKKAAEEAGYAGAMFPWQSGEEGSEQSQSSHLNPLSQEWTPDNSRLQRHVSLAIAYNVWLYWTNTHDEDYMQAEGLELLVEITKFWESTASRDETGERYDIKGVMGPDEFHEEYPDSETPGLANNAYTNVMVSWLFDTMAKMAKIFPDTFDELTSDGEAMLQQLADIRTHLNLELTTDGLLAQYKGFFDLSDIDLDAYREKYQNIQRMDRILSAEGKDINAYKIAKQADTMMLFFNFATSQVTTLLTEMGYEMPEDYMAKNFDYYINHTSHGSTLSRVVYAALAGRLDDVDQMWTLYREALGSDYDDIQGGTTAEGIHLGVMATTVTFPLTVFAGIELTNEQLVLNPELPEQWRAVSFNIQKQQVNYDITLAHDAVTITADQDSDVVIGDQTASLTADQTQTIAIK